MSCSLFIWGCGSAPPARSSGSAFRSPPRPGAPAPAGAIRKIVIDAGHGGHDPGTSHFGLKEKYMALDIAKRLRASLEQAGFTVVLTRETDQFIPLSRRPEIANRLHADLFVSVHINANKSSRINGIEVYYPRSSVVSSNAQWPPLISSSEVAIPSLTIKQVLWDLVLRRTRVQSRQLGHAVCRSMRDELEAPCRGTRGARFVVLREAWMPAVLVEVGYVSNREEARRLGNPDYRQAAAQSIARGIIAYVRQVGAEHI
jgi:N-acetylmuramoyl-L-alanine amidase